MESPTEKLYRKDVGGFIYFHVTSKGLTQEQWKEAMPFLEVDPRVYDDIGGEKMSVLTKGVRYYIVIHHGRNMHGNCISDPKQFIERVIRDTKCYSESEKLVTELHWELIYLICEALTNEILNELKLSGVVALATVWGPPYCLYFEPARQGLGFAQDRRILNFCEGYPGNRWRDYFGWAFVIPE